SVHSLQDSRPLPRRLSRGHLLGARCSPMPVSRCQSAQALSGGPRPPPGHHSRCTPERCRRPRQVSRCPLRHGPPGATADWCRASLLSPLSVRSATSHQALLLLPFCNEELTHMTNPTPPPPLPQGFPLSPQAPSGQPVPSQPVSQPLPYAATSSLP